MLIGRADDPQSPCRVVADKAALSVWEGIAEPIWASGHVRTKQAGHTNALAPDQSPIPKNLDIGGPSTHALHVLATDALVLVMYVDGVWPKAQAALHAAIPDRRVQALAWVIWVLVLAAGAWTAWRIKQVETDGENLFISNFRQEVSVPIVAIIDVRQNLWAGSGLVWLVLEEETPPELLPWGRRIAFLPTARVEFGFNRYQPHPIVAELLEQSAQARRARGLARIQQASAGALGRRGGFGYTPRS